MSALQFIADVIGSLAWPGLVVSVFLTVWFTAPKEQRAGLLGRVRKVGKDGAELDAAARAVTSATEPGRESGKAGAAGKRQSPSLAPSDLPYDEATRQRIDRIIRAAAQWGWVRAGGAPSQFPRPIIGWTPHGATILRVSDQASITSDTLTFAPGSFIDAHTGRPNTSAYVDMGYGSEPEDIEEPRQ